MTGYATKRAQNQVPSPLKKATWQDHLRAWEQAAIERYVTTGSSSNANQDIISDCMDQMQILFPGNYTLVWHQPAPNEYHLTVHFADPKHGTMWRMKYA